jgi:hypothetical protein
VSGEAKRFPVGSRVRIRDTGKVVLLRSYMDPGDPFGTAPRNATGVRAYVLPVGGGLEFDVAPGQLVSCAQE